MNRMGDGQLQTDNTRPVILVGFMCSGKTTLGKAVAAMSGRSFVDLDQYIEKQQNRTISDIFAADGEDAFRRIEQDTLENVLNNTGASPMILALGGGTPCRPGIMEMLNRRGTTVHLDVAPEKLVERLVDGARSRPLMAGKSKNQIHESVTQMLETRNPFYRMAQLRFDASNLENEQQITESARKFLNLLKSRSENQPT